MPGVNVIIKGTSTGTATDGSGQYRLNVAGNQAVLVLSFIGYVAKEVSVGAQSTLDVQMEIDVQTLSELVVTGYATQEKKDITGSVSILKERELNAVPASNPEALLQGRVAGVTVTTNPAPGAAASVRIRGLATFGNNTPLYVVDGVPTLDISSLNPNDIESMNVLKDAGAASIYGSRATNGVIIISTKKGKSGKVIVTYDGSYGFQNAGNGYKNLLNPQEQADLEWLSNKNSGLANNSANYGSGATPVLPDYTIPTGAKNGSAAVDPALYNVDYSKGPIYQITQANKSGTNWFKESTQTAPITNQNLTLSGGGENSKYLVGFNYFNQQGTVIETYLKRYTVRANTEFNIKNKVRIGENFTVSVRRRNNIAGAEGIFNYMYTLQSIVPVYDIKGGFGSTRGQNLGNQSSPVAALKRSKDNLDFDTRIFGNVYAEADLIKGLTVRTSFGGAFQNGYNTNFSYHTYENSENNGTNSFSENASYNAEWTWTNTATYKKTFGDHNVSIVAGTEAVEQGIGRGVGGTRIDYFSDDPKFWTLTTGAGGISNYSYSNTPSTLFSYLGRADYGYKDKYLLSATIRRDGSSKFISQFGVFPSITGAWRISQEGFMSGNNIFNDLKLRAGYGVMGGQININSTSQYNIYGGRKSDAYYDLSGSSSNPAQGLWLTNIGNPAGQWEENKTTNIGIDASFLKGRLDVTLDVYQKVTDGLLFQLDIPAVNGNGVAPFKNVAKMSNKGFDMQVIYKGVIATDWRYEANLTFTTYKNNIESLAPDVKFFDVNSAASEEGRIGGRFVRNEAGHPISSFFGYKVIGLFQSAGEVTGAPAQEGAGPGRFRYADVNSDGVITPDDRTYIGDPNPNFTYGLNLNVGYKAFDFTVFFYGVQGKDLVNYTKWWNDFVPSFQTRKSKNALYNSWTPTNTGATTPIAETASNISTNQAVKSYYIEDGSYLRAKNIQLAYNLPSAMANKVGLNRARIYVQGVNLFTVTKYSGLDPELGGNDNGFGVDGGQYPNTKQYIFGLNLSF